MNNKEQNVNLNGTPQNHYTNRGYPQQKNQYQGNGNNGQNPQYNNQQYQGYNNNQNPQFRGQSYNGQNPQFRGQPYNGQNTQFNNMNNPQYAGQGYNGQNPQFDNPNNPQFSNQNGYNNPNQFNPQFGNNQNFNPMNRGPKLDSKMAGYITAAVAAILVVLMISMFSGGSGKLGGATPEEAVREVIAATSKGDFEKTINYAYYENEAERDKDRKEFEVNLKTEKDNLEEARKAAQSAVILESSIDGDTALVKVEIKKDDSDSDIVPGRRNAPLRRVNNRWFLVNGFY